MKITGIIYALMGLSLGLALQTGCTGRSTTEEMIPETPPTLASATEIINNRCPEWVDPESRLDSVLLSHEGQLYYYYTLPNKDGAEMNPTAFGAFLMPKIIENIHYNPDLKMHRDSSVTMVFNYRGRNGELITEFSVGPEMYR